MITDLPDEAIVRALRGDIDADLESLMPDPTVAWAVSRELAGFLASLVWVGRVRSILEFGAGQSSVLFAGCLSKAGGGRLTSVESEPAFSAAAWARALEFTGVNAEMVVSRVARVLRASGLHYSYVDARDNVATRGPYEVVLVDAPPGRLGRDGSLHLAADFVCPGGVIVLDDAGRPSERRTIGRWLSQYRGLRLVVDDRHFGRYGVAVLRAPETLAARFCLRAFVGSILSPASSEK